MKTFEYFISYYFRDNLGCTGFGNIIIEIKNDINKMRTSEIEKYIIKNTKGKGRKLNDACIISYQLRKTIKEIKKKK